MKQPRSESPTRRSATVLDRRALASVARRLAAFAFALAVGCAAPQKPLVLLRDGRPAMGTILEITILAPDEVTGRKWIDGAFARVAEIERQISSWEPTSAISRLNRLASAGPAELEVEPLVLEILADAKWLARQTDGAFDVSVGPLIALWRDGARTNRLPEAEARAAAKSAVGADRIGLAGDRVSLAEGMSIDLGGLAKGWALERVEGWLRGQGASRGLLNFGGSSLLAMGSPLDGPAWRVLVGAGERSLGVLALRESHAAVSASLGQSYMIGSERYGHVVDPRSGSPVNREILAVAVGRSGATTEAWSTALLVRGTEGLPAATASGLEVMVVEGAKVTRSQDFPRFDWVEPPSKWNW